MKNVYRNICAQFKSASRALLPKSKERVNERKAIYVCGKWLMNEQWSIVQTRNLQEGIGNCEIQHCSCMDELEL